MAGGGAHGGSGCGGVDEANKHACELAWVLRRLSMGLDGGEHERGALAPAAATMAAELLRVARGEEQRA
jgi:hypothetical protein